MRQGRTEVGASLTGASYRRCLRPRGRSTRRYANSETRLPRAVSESRAPASPSFLALFF